MDIVLGALRTLEGSMTPQFDSSIPVCAFEPLPFCTTNPVSGASTTETASNAQSPYTPSLLSPSVIPAAQLSVSFLACHVCDLARITSLVLCWNTPTAQSYRYCARKDGVMFLDKLRSEFVVQVNYIYCQILLQKQKLRTFFRSTKSVETL